MPDNSDDIPFGSGCSSADNDPAADGSVSTAHYFADRRAHRSLGMRLNGSRLHGSDSHVSSASEVRQRRLRCWFSNVDVLLSTPAAGERIPLKNHINEPASVVEQH